MDAVTIKIPVRIYDAEYAGTVKGYCSRDEIFAYSVGSKSHVERELKARVSEAIESLIVGSSTENQQRALVVCGSGEVLLVSRRFGSWGYEILRKEGRGCSTSGRGSFQEIFDDAKSHADQSYGGVLWSVVLA